MTYIDAVHHIAAQHAVTGLSADDCQNVLWNHTAFPCSGPEYTLKQVYEFFTLGAVCQDCHGMGRIPR